MSHPNCWARALGECSDKISGEHIITAAIHESGKSFSIDRDDGSSLRMTRGNFTAKMLCTTHNSKLSIADNEAVKLHEALKSIHSLPKGRQFHVVIDADRFESWLTKTMINSVVSGISNIARSTPRRQAPVEKRLIEIAFGQRAFTNGGGAYVISRFESREKWGANYHFAPILGNGQHVCGMIFKFSALWFLLWASDIPVSAQVQEIKYLKDFSFSPLCGKTEFFFGDELAATIEYKRGSANNAMHATCEDARA
jgi:hypothetical protein